MEVSSRALHQSQAHGCFVVLLREHIVLTGQHETIHTVIDQEAWKAVLCSVDVQ